MGGAALIPCPRQSQPKGPPCVDIPTPRRWGAHNSLPMSKKAAESHKHAATHHAEAAKHHTEAAKHHEAGHHEKAAHHAHTAAAHTDHAAEHTTQARKAHAEEHGNK